MKIFTILFIVLFLGTYSSEIKPKSSVITDKTSKTKRSRYTKVRSNDADLRFLNLKDSLDLVINKKIIAIEKINRAIAEKQVNNNQWKKK